MFETYDPYGYSLESFLPYGMGALTTFLKQHNYYVEQEDLVIKFNYPNKASSITSIFKNNIDLDISGNIREIRSFFESGEIEGDLGSFLDKILNSIPMEGFNIIGFSIYTFYHFLFALMLSKRIKQKTGIPIVFGGPFINLYGCLYPDAFNSIDYMIVGDGRVPLLKLIDYLQGKTGISEIPNLIYKDNGKVATNPREYYPIEDIPIPDFEGLPMHLYKRPQFGYIYTTILPYQISRNCTGRCSFCNYKNVNRPIEFKSYDKVINELMQMKERYKSKRFYFCDDTINNSYEYLEGLCNLFIKHKLDIEWYVFAKVGNLDKHILKKMKMAGCQWLFFGVESGSDRILKMMNKGFTSEQAAATLKDSYEAGLQNCVYFIAGYLSETQEDINQTLKFIKKNRKYIHLIFIFEFSLEYGSEIYFNFEKHGITNLYPTPSRVIFAFDESGGLKWEQKHKQQEHSKRQIIRAMRIFRVFPLNWRMYLGILFRFIIVRVYRLRHII
jgi:hypothetical protein